MGKWVRSKFHLPSPNLKLTILSVRLKYSTCWSPIQMVLVLIFERLALNFPPILSHRTCLVVKLCVLFVRNVNNLSWNTYSSITVDGHPNLKLVYISIRVVLLEFSECSCTLLSIVLFSFSRFLPNHFLTFVFVKSILYFSTRDK